MRNITADTTPVPAGTTTYQDDTGYHVVSRGSITLGRTTYQAREVTSTAGENSAYLIGPRGAIYNLVPFDRSGVFQLISFNSGQAMRRQGNEVLVIRLGDIFEETSRAALAASRARR